MAKIIKLDENIVSIGTADGGIKEVRISDLNFEPAIGDEVEVFENEGSVIVTKKEVNVQEPTPSGININVSNNQNAGTPVNAPVYTKAVNKATYCLLAFFLGGIGIHKFYAGKTGAGVVYILFCWTGIPAFIALIEFIIGLCKKADANGNILV